MITKKKVAVLGLGETGLASALFLKKLGYSVFVSDSSSTEIVKQRAESLAENKIPYELGGHTLEKVGACDWTVISPGIPPAADIYLNLLKKQIPVVSEVEVASWFSPGEVIAVTGTSGKSSVATLLSRIFQANGIPSVACGNLGNSWIGELSKFTAETQIVLELSSFQLLHTWSFKPKIGILLNIGMNHLDWHLKMEDYVSAKLRLFQNQGAAGFALIRRQDQKNFFPTYPFKGQIRYWGEKQNSTEELFGEITRLKNLDPKKTSEVIERFEGLEHRLEKIAEIDGIKFYNDSKCTTLEALVWGLEKFHGQKIILLAGGHAKGADFPSVRKNLTTKVKRAVVFGEASDLLKESWEGASPITQAKDLKEAFREALKVASSGDVILLSPACASFDQFTNYKERGKAFKELVAELKGSTVSHS